MLNKWFSDPLIKMVNCLVSSIICIERFGYMNDLKIQIVTCFDCEWIGVEHSVFEQTAHWLSKWCTMEHKHRQAEWYIKWKVTVLLNCIHATQLIKFEGQN